MSDVVVASQSPFELKIDHLEPRLLLDSAELPELRLAAREDLELTMTVKPL